MASHCNPPGDRLSLWDTYQTQIKTEQKKFHKRLEDFPNSFHLEGHLELRDNTLSRIRNHLEAAIKAGYRTDMETAQSLNLLSFVLFKLKEVNKALESVNKALDLKGQHENIVSLANKAYILWHMGEFVQPEAPEDQVKKLENLRESEDFEYLTVKAKAELAASYMRFGHDFNKYAIETFNTVIPKGREPEVWSWKLALAVAYRHTLDLQHVPHASGEKEDKHMKVLHMLQEIADKSDCPQLKANALAETALVLWSTWDVKTGQALCDAVKAGPMKICKDALKCDANEPSVLRKVGQIFRYYKDVHSSLKYLKKAVKLQKSSAAYHHLGLTYKAFATEHKYGTLRKRRGRRSRGRRRGRHQGQEDNFMQANREHGDADMNQDGRDVRVRCQTERKSTIRPESVFHDEHRGHPGRRQRQLGPGAARRGSGAVHRGEQGCTKTYTNEHNVPLNVRQRLQTLSGTGKGTSEIIQVETDDAYETVRAAGYSQRPADDTERHGRPQQQITRQKQHYKEADSQSRCQQSSHSPLSRSESETHKPSDSDTELKKVMHESTCNDTESDDDAESVASRSVKPDRLPKTIKSPPNEGVTRFSTNDMYVTKTIKNLQKAVEFSAGENTRALYDLALMYKALDKYDEALACLQKISANTSAGALDIIAAYEQAGLILHEKAEKAQDEGNRNRQKEKADSMLRKALISASHLYSKSAELQGRFDRVFQSPIALLKAVQESDKSHQDKEKGRAELLHLIQKYDKSLSVLKKMATTDPKCKDNADYQVINIRNLCDMGSFDEAVTSFELLKSTQLHQEVRERLEGLEKNYVLDMYLQAERRSPHDADSKAVPFIKNIFQDTFKHPNPNTTALAIKSTASRDNRASEDSTGVKYAITACDVAVIHEDEDDEEEEEEILKEIQNKAEIVADILNGYDLTVITTSKLHPGFQSKYYIVDKVEKLLLVVLVGRDHISEHLEFQIKAAKTDKVPIAILLVNGASLPRELRGYRAMKFPDELQSAGHGTDAAISVIQFLLSHRPV